MINSNIVLITVLTVIKWVMSKDEIEVSGNMKQNQNLDYMKKFTITDKIKSHFTEIHGRGSDELLKGHDIDFKEHYGKLSVLSNEEEANNESIISKFHEINHDVSDTYHKHENKSPVITESVERMKPKGAILERQSAEDKFAFAPTDRADTLQLENINKRPRSILSDSPRVGNFPYSNQIGNNMYPIGNMPLLQQQIRSFYNTKFYNPAKNNAVPLQNAGRHHTPPNPYAVALKSTFPEQLSLEDDLDKNAYLYSPPSQIEPNYYQSQNALNYRFVN